MQRNFFWKFSHSAFECWDTRNDSHQSEVARYVKDKILTLTAGVQSLPGIFVVGATNYPELIDTAYLDRCTKMIKMDLPSQEAKYSFLKTYMAKQDRDHQITAKDFQALNTNLYSYRTLEGLLSAAIEEGPIRRAEDANHFRIIEGDENDMFEACSCEDPECGKVVRNYFDIPPENLKLSPLTVDDLVKASR